MIRSPRLIVPAFAALAVCCPARSALAQTGFSGYFEEPVSEPETAFPQAHVGSTAGAAQRRRDAEASG